MAPGPLNANLSRTPHCLGGSFTGGRVPCVASLRTLTLDGRKQACVRSSVRFGHIHSTFAVVRYPFSVVVVLFVTDDHCFELHNTMVCASRKGIRPDEERTGRVDP